MKLTWLQMTYTHATLPLHHFNLCQLTIRHPWVCPHPLHHRQCLPTLSDWWLQLTTTAGGIPSSNPSPLSLFNEVWLNNQFYKSAICVPRLVGVVPNPYFGTQVFPEKTQTLNLLLKIVLRFKIREVYFSLVQPLKGWERLTSTVAGAWKSDSALQMTSSGEVLQSCWTKKSFNIVPNTW